MGLGFGLGVWVLGGGGANSAYLVFCRIQGSHFLSWDYFLIRIFPQVTIRMMLSCFSADSLPSCCWKNYINANATLLCLY